MTEPEKLLSVFKKARLFFHKDIGNFRYCPTGELYQIVTSDGIKSEGAIDKVFKSESDAFSAWEQTIKKIISNLRGKPTIFWRRMPEMRRLETKSEWKVYSRFIISALPIIQDADYNKGS